MKRLDTYSQNFLRNPQFVRELIKSSDIQSSDTVYDIGAGSGIISSSLAEVCKSVIAIEFEPATAKKLRENMSKFSNVKVVEGDFLTMPLPNFTYKIFANIPFHLSSQIVRKITEAVNPPEVAYLIVQKQFANKLLPDFSGFTNQLGMLIGPKFSVKIKKQLKRTDFYPNPNVDTVLIEIAKRSSPLIDSSDQKTYQKFIISCFTDPKIFAAKLKLASFSKPGVKPSQLTLAQWINLFLICKL